MILLCILVIRYERDFNKKFSTCKSLVKKIYSQKRKRFLKKIKIYEIDYIMHKRIICLDV